MAASIIGMCSSVSGVRRVRVSKLVGGAFSAFAVDLHVIAVEILNSFLLRLFCARKLFSYHAYYFGFLLNRIHTKA